MSEIEATNDVAALTVQLLSAYLANNTVASEDIAGLIRSTKDALTSEPQASAEIEPETFTPAVSVRKSLASPEHIISLIDGKPYKTLKRHLQSRGLTPDDYLSRYNLPASYPMVAPAYADKRREAAQQLGLGRRKPEAADSATADAAAEVINGSADPQTNASPPPTETKQVRAPAEKKGRDRSATSARAKDLEPPVALSPEPDEANIDQAATSTSTEGSETDVPSASRRQAKSVAKKPKSTSAPTEAAASRRGKSQAKSARASEPAAEVSGLSQDSAADEQLAQKPKRRAKPGVFEKTDGAQAGSHDEGAIAAPPVLDSELVVAATETPMKRKSPKRMACSAEVKKTDHPGG